MKVERTTRAGGPGGFLRLPAGRRASPRPATGGTVLGIPEAEFTPRVRDAVLRLIEQSDSLRRELHTARQALERVERAADQDHLLPLLNRRAFMRELSRHIGFATRYGTPASLVYFDLDDFKRINDTWSHAAGDAVLAHFAETLLAHVRESDVVARLGGDEFGVILSHTSEAIAHRKAASLADVLAANPAQWSGSTIAVGFSYGAFELAPGEKAETAIARADEAMYANKKAAR